MSDAATASQIVKDAIDRECDGDYPSICREEAVDAVADRRAAILTRGSYHNQFALSACYRVNAGGQTLDNAIQSIATEQGRSVEEVGWIILASVVGVNQLGKFEIQSAKSWLRSPLRIAAE